MRAISLGATLYVPALKETLLECAYGADPAVRSIVICLEDAIRDDEVERAERAFSRALAAFAAVPPSVLVYVRPRDPDMLTRLLRMSGIGEARGFVIPKATTRNLPHWLSIVTDHPHEIMPTIEGVEAFDRPALLAMCDQLRPYVDRTTAIRIGGNDILNLFGVRRSRTRTAYDGPLADAIRTIGSVFVPSGFAVAAPVFEHYAALDVLEREVEQDIEHGLLTKTAIHPRQVEVIHRVYQPTAAEMVEARMILDENADAVFGLHGSMCEPTTHVGWASNIIQRARVHGTPNRILSYA